MKNLKYFENPKSLEELKAQYKKLAMKHHPDIGGSTVAMQEVNNEYDNLFQSLKNIHSTADGKTYTSKTETTETADMFKDIISKIINFQGCTIEIIGSWIWVSGDTFQYKDTLKELKFKWCKNKKSWAYHNDDYRKKSKQQYTLENLRNMYDSEIIATNKVLQLV